MAKKFSFFKLKRVFFFVLGAVVLGLVFLGFFLITVKVPDLSTFSDRKVVQSTKIYDRTGEILLWDVHQNIKRTVVAGNQFSTNLRNAVVAIEDSNFYNHPGVDIKGIMRAVFANFFSGSRSQGGSTITQQLVRNAILTTKKSYVRKIKEAILALKVEKIYSKEKILELYLNEIPFGGSLYGAEATAREFFGKSASELSLPESAYMAAVIQAPTRFSPYGNNKKDLEDRKNVVLMRMRELGFITKEEEILAKTEKVNFIGKGDQSIKAPHFSFFIRSYLEEKFGTSAVEQNGLKVITTLDYTLQQKAEELVLKFANENKEKFNASNAGLVAIDPKTGQILTMVGSRDYFDMENGGNFNIALAKRQPGSSFKPFVYATAFKEGYLPATTLFDLLTEFNPSCNPDGTPRGNTPADHCYHPSNFDDKFRGPISLRNALAQSINVPSVKALYLSGIKDSIQTATDLGLSTLTDPDRYGLTLVLGGGEVSLLEMTGAYSVFANKGEKNETTGILKIEDASGNVLQEYKPETKNVLDKNVALMISDVLSDYEAKRPSYGATSPLYFPDRRVAAKTGTTNDVRDAWVVGYTPNISVGVWCGNNDNSPMVKKVAGMITAPLWRAFMDEALRILPLEEFEKPSYPDPNTTKPIISGQWQGGLSYKIDKISKKLATEYTPPELIETKVVGQIHSILYWIDKNNPLGDSPTNPTGDSQFNNWETPIRKWAQDNGYNDQGSEIIPTEYDDVHRPEYAPRIDITYPTVSQKLDPEARLPIKISHSGRFPLKRVDFFLNNAYLGSSERAPFELLADIQSIENKNTQSVVKVIAYDTVSNRSEVSIPVSF